MTSAARSCEASDSSASACRPLRISRAPRASSVRAIVPPRPPVAQVKDTRDPEIVGVEEAMREVSFAGRLHAVEKRPNGRGRREVIHEVRLTERTGRWRL